MHRYLRVTGFGKFPGRDILFFMDQGNSSKNATPPDLILEVWLGYDGVYTETVDRDRV
jgi:hypothetical protein